ncbi:MAG: insulinase family protein [Deltaproteobacteria bacterium]|nr:insulinase family protein [Deltaproteobacteria bacterium]
MCVRVVGAVLLAAASCLAVTVQAHDKPKNDRGPNTVHSHKLANGLVVLVEEDGRAPTASVNLYYRVGSRNDPPGKMGTTALAMRMMTHSTQHVPAGMYAKILLRAGADNTSDTVASDRSMLGTIVPADRIALPMWLWSDQMGFFVPQATSDSLSLAKESMRSEWGHKVQGSPAATLYSLAETSVFDALHPYHRPSTADPKEFDTVQVRDVQELHQKWFVPDNAVLSVAGLVEPKAVIELAEKYFGPIPKGNPGQPQVPAPPKLVEDTWIEGVAPVNRPELRIYWPTPAYETPGDYEMDSAASVLAGGPVRWMDWDLVDKRAIAEDVWAHQYSREWGSAFTVSVTLANGHTHEEALQAVDAVIARLATEGASDVELMRANRFLAISDMFAFERPRNRAQRNAHCQLRYGEASCLLRRIHRLEEMKSAEMRSVVAQMQKSGRVVLIVRPSAGAPVTGVVTSKTQRSKP